MTQNYEQVVHQHVREQLLRRPDRVEPSLTRRAQVEDVRLGSESNPDVVVLFRARERPECLFGFRMEARSPPDDEAHGIPPKTWAAIIVTNFEESVITHSFRGAHCRPDEVVWID